MQGILTPDDVTRLLARQLADVTRVGPCQTDKALECALANGVLETAPLQRLMPDARVGSHPLPEESGASFASEPIENSLIDRLPREARRHLLAQCESIDLRLSDVLANPGIDAEFVYFPVNSFVSLLTVVSGEVGLEVGMVGREGMLGSHVSLGVTASPLHALVQGPGSAWRLETALFSAELARSASLRKVMGLYVYVLMEQLATSAGCARYHEIGPRLARWLLMSQDRAHANTFHMTQEFLGFMLGVRRVGVTEAAGELQRAGLIEYRRGRLTVLDRTGLEAAACSCYETDRKSALRLADVRIGRP